MLLGFGDRPSNQNLFLENVPGRENIHRLRRANPFADSPKHPFPNPFEGKDERFPHTVLFPTNLKHPKHPSTFVVFKGN